MNERIASACVCCGGTNLNKSPAILMPFIADRVFGWKPVKIDANWHLNTIKNGMAYPICNSVQCKDCNHLFLDIRFSDVEMIKLYKDYRGKDYCLLREKYEPGYLEKNKKLSYGHQYKKKVENFLKPFLEKPIRILDWGGHDGRNTPFKKQSELLHIYDISNANYVNQLKTLSKENLKKYNYNLIICGNVLEHVPFPITTLREIKFYMDYKTILYIELPFENIVREAEDISMLYKQKKHWHEHINFFNESSILEVINSLEMKLLKLNYLEIQGETSDQIFQVCLTLR